MRLIIMISITVVGAFTANAQYFKGRGKVHTRYDATRDYFNKYIEARWSYLGSKSQANIESPIVRKTSENNTFSRQIQSGVSTLSIDRANQYHREKPWQGVYLRPLVEFAYSLYEPRYIPNGN